MIALLTLLRHVHNNKCSPCVHNFKAAIVAPIATQGHLSATTYHFQLSATYTNLHYILFIYFFAIKLLFEHKYPTKENGEH